MSRSLALSFLALILALPAAAQDVAGLWDGTVRVNNAFDVPFELEFSGSGKALKAWFFNGPEKVISASGEAGNGAVAARFPQYNSRLELKATGQGLDGTYFRDGKTYPIRAVRHVSPAAPTATVPRIDGSWLIQTGNETGEKTWLMQLNQQGTQVTGSVLRVDGDTGVLTGSFRDGHFVISHFSGARPIVFSLTPKPDGSLDVVQNESRRLIAVRAEAARDKGVDAPDDPLHHTTLSNPAEPLRFSFPDLTGKLVTNTDPRFKGKVVIISIGGSWCPNCHDEAPFLGELYRKFHAQGLEIVELSFEEAEQLANPTRLREFIRKYRIQYPVLLAGEPEQLAAKFPQAVRLDAFPTTFFVGRDGLVKQIHAGFAGAATGRKHTELKAEITATIRELLAAR